MPLTTMNGKLITVKKAAEEAEKYMFGRCNEVTGNILPAIEYFATKEKPVTAGSAHLFSAMTGAADYATVTAHPTYSAWV